MTERAESEKFFTNADGQKIYCRYWNEDAENESARATEGGKPRTTRGLVFLCHGLGEHTLWYNEIADILVRQGFYTFGHDHLGHGQSEGPRVHVDDFNYYVRDVFQHIDEVKKRFSGNTPVFILGHSMGGAISILSAMEKPEYFTGVILSGPAVVASPELASPVKIFFGKIIARIIPQLVIERLKVDNATRNQEAIKKYLNDPMYHGLIKAKWGLSALTATQYIQSKLDTIEWTFLVLHGDTDLLTDVSGSQLMYDKALSKDKTIKIYKGYYHALLQEPIEDREVVQKDIVEWLLKHS